MVKNYWPGLMALSLAGCGAPQPAPQNSAAQRARTAGASAVVEQRPEAVRSGRAGAGAAEAAHPCLVQDGRSVAHRLKALGTEPFWAAEVEGRCVTYKTPEDQRGTRVWARVETSPDGLVWNGALGGREFQLTVRPAAGCSDGMSDRRYPMTAAIKVNGEMRRGCASPELEGLGARP